MKKLTFTCLLVSFLYNSLQAQLNRPNSIQISYFGETVTHPGLKVNLIYNIKEWEKIKSEKKTKVKYISMQPGLGIYTHKNYQTGLLLLNDICYSRITNKRKWFSSGIGLGFLRTFLPDVYELNSKGEIVKKYVGYNHAVFSYHMEFGKQVKFMEKEIGLRIRPTVIYAFPNYKNGVFYPFVEFGVNLKLKHKESLTSD